mgnify:CR=1 FL=1
MFSVVSASALFFADTAGSTANKAASPVTIQYATWDATREKADKKVIAAFEKSHPEIKVKYNLVAWDTYWQKAAAMTAGGATFDVMWMNLDNFPFYANYQKSTTRVLPLVMMKLVEEIPVMTEADATGLRQV